MTHRGTTDADSWDGDGVGVMTGIPHLLFKREAERDLGCVLPELGQYAVENIFFKANDPVPLQKQQAILAKLSSDLGLRVLGSREAPTDGTILGRAASSKKPAILQPFDDKRLERQLYVLRKHATHSM